MRVLVAGHDGYIGAVLVPLLQRAGHGVVGLDTGLFTGCLFGQQAARVESSRKDIQDVAVEDLRGFYAIIDAGKLDADLRWIDSGAARGALAARREERRGLQELPAVWQLGGAPGGPRWLSGAGLRYA